MANTYKDIVITPNKSSATDDPKIVFSGANASVNTDITLRVYPESNGTLSFEGTAGQLFSITNDLSGSIFSVNDISGIPSIDVQANGTISIAPFGGNVSIDSSVLFVDTFGNKVGIGTTSPDSKLDITQTTTGKAGIYVNMPTAAETTAAGITVKGYSPAIELMDKDSIQNWYIGIDDNDSNKLLIGRGYGPGQSVTQAITIDTSDKVGIGTASPAYKLDVNGTVHITGSGSYNVIEGNVTRFDNPSGTLGNTAGEIVGPQVYQPTVNYDAAMTFHVAGDYAVHFGLDGYTNDLFVGGWSMGAVKYKIWHAGNDGTGSGLDADTLDGSHASSFVTSGGALGTPSTGTLTNCTGLPVGGISATGTPSSSTYLRGDGSWQTISSGGLTVNAESSSASTYYPLFTSSTTGSLSFANVSNSGLYFVPSTGTLSATIFNSLSDITLKTDIEGFDGIVLLDKINPVSFRWKQTGTKSYGVIAQELEKTLPELVDTNDKGIKSVSYIPMIAMLVDTVKKQEERITKLEQLLNAK